MNTHAIALFDHTNIDEMPWPDTPQARQVRQTFVPIIKNGAQQYVKNVKSPVGVLLVNQKVFPVVRETAGIQSHVGSLYGHYIIEACEEARKFRGLFFRNISQFFVSRFGGPFFKNVLSQNIQIDNWLVTTNIHTEITTEDVVAIIKYITKEFPDRAIVFRSLTKYTDQALMQSLKNNNFSLIASRQIYIWDYAKPAKYSIKARHALRKDDLLAKQAGYEWTDLNRSNHQDIARISDLYRCLYLEKYSWHNPQYTEKFIIEHCNDPDGFLQIQILMKDKRIDGFIGYYIRQGILTAPFVGYDTRLPQKAGLYRMIMAKIRQEAQERNLVLNGSAGAGDFKRTRGGISITEFFAVYDQHLNGQKRLNWFLLRLIMNTIGLRVLRSNVL